MSKHLRNAETLPAVGSPLDGAVGRRVNVGTEEAVMSLLGLTIVPHMLARDRRTEFKVVRWATRSKKRKNWRVLRVEIDRPGCWQVGDTLYMHPELIAKLPKQQPNEFGHLLTQDALWDMYAR